MEPRNVTEEMGHKMSEELKISYFETSALNGQGIKEAFEQLKRDIMEKKGLGERNNRNQRGSFDIGKKKKEKKGSDCC